jgi:hypothetical protein
LVKGFIIFFIGIVSFGALTANNKTSFYFYNPETNVTKFASLKKAFDLYLSDFGAYEFQPFKKVHLFEEQVRLNNECIVLIPSWYYKNFSSDLQLKPVLIAKSNNKIKYKKKLVSKRNIRYLDQLKSTTIASSGNKEIVKKLLNEMLLEEGLSQTLKILIVPKDIDALMAVEFGMAKAALTNEKSLYKLKSVAPKQYSKLTTLSESSEEFLPVVAIPKLSRLEKFSFMSVIREMQMKQQGKVLLKRLGFDSWESVDENVLAELNT